MAVHLIGFPFTVVVPPIAPLVLAMPADVIVFELANVTGAIMPTKRSFAVLSTIDVCTFVASFVWPCLYSMPMLLVILPVALINGTIVVNVLSSSVSFIITPLTLIYVAI